MPVRAEAAVRWVRIYWLKRVLNDRPCRASMGMPDFRVHATSCFVLIRCMSTSAGCVLGRTGCFYGRVPVNVALPVSIDACWLMRRYSLLLTLVSYCGVPWFY